MKLIPAVIGLSAALLVGGAMLQQSYNAGAEFCAHQQQERMRLSQAPAGIPESISGYKSQDDFYRLYPPTCGQPITGFDIANCLLGGSLIGFGVYSFGLLFGKFARWASR